MKWPHFVRYSIGFLCISCVLALSTAAYINWSALPIYPTPIIKEMKVEVTPERVEKGKKIAAMMCVVCHTGSDQKLSGKFLNDLPPVFGKIYSKNITQSNEYGIGNWKDGEIAYFLRTGLRKNGVYSPPYMPKFPNISDEDLHSIIAWLRSDDERLKASEVVTSQTQLSFFSKFLGHFIMKPLPFPNAVIPMPDTSNAIQYGEYIANAVYGCYTCHSRDFAKQDPIHPEKSFGYYAGGNPVLNQDGQAVLSANLTMSNTKGIGNYTEDEFVRALKTGVKKNGKMVSDPMFPHSLLTDLEAKSIFAFLKSIPVLE